MEKAQWTKIENEFWSTHEHLCGKDSDYEPVLEAVLAPVREAAQEEKLDVEETRAKLHESQVVVAEITGAMKHNWPDAPAERFWLRFSPDLSSPTSWRLFDLASDWYFDRGKYWFDVSPIDREELEQSTARYLNQPWLQNNMLDWYILRAFLFDNLLRLYHGVQSGDALGEWNLAYSFTKGRMLPRQAVRFGIDATIFTARWILLPVAAVLFFLRDDATMGVALAGVFSAFVLLNVVLLPRSIARRRERTRRLAVLTDRQARLRRLVGVADASVLNPARLRDQLVEAETHGLVMPSVVYSILDRAIERDPAVFTPDG